MPRQFPLFRSFHNLVWNIKHYQPSARRPPFKASRHPFCTNIQLRDASYAYWFEETSRDIRQKLAEKNENHSDSVSKHSSKPADVSLRALSSAHSSTDNSAPPNSDKPKLEISTQEIEIVRLFQTGKYGEMYTRLKEYKAQDIHIPIELLNEMASRIYNTLPTNSIDPYLLQSVVEPPAFYLKDDLRYLKLYSRIQPGLTGLYKIFSLYESVGLQNEKFLSHYIWLCYHEGDLQTIQKLLYIYLQSPSYDSRTLSHVINAFVYNYEVSFAKSLLDSIVAMNKPLSEALVSSTIVAFVKVGALYDNLYDVSQLWLTSENCESLYPKTIALLIKQTYRYGTEKEISLVDELCSALEYDNNFLVQMVRCQAKILHRDNNQKKSLTEEDVSQILKVRNALGKSKHALKIYYESYILFFAKYCTMAMVQLILKEMRKDEIPISKFAYDAVVQHYVSGSKFVLLSQFMQKFVSRYVLFEPIYAKLLFEAFIRTYPYHGKDFAHSFHDWLQNTPLLSKHDKSAIGQACQISTSGSKMTPCSVKRPNLKDSKIYTSPGWKNIEQSARRIVRVQKRHQIQFRMTRGLRDVLRKGIRPDYHVIEETLKNSNPTKRRGILESLPAMRMGSSVTRLRVHHFLLAYPRKDHFTKFAEKHLESLNTSDKLFVARRSLNSYNTTATSLLLDSLSDVDMTDGRHMIALNLRLRNCILKKDYAGCVKFIDSFPIDGITLSPYIYDQCRYIEKSLSRQLKGSGASAESIRMALEKLRGLIGDIQIRLDKDEVDIRVLIRDSFRMLSDWVEMSRKQDERKA
ncbi:hypothetical protein OXX69_010064 [Metschnikowia pulcherrima]